MNWNELEQLWRSAPAAAPAGCSAADCAARRRVLARAVAWRDWSEAAVGFGVATLFAAVLVFFRLADWRGWLAVALVLAVSGFFVAQRRRARSRQVPPEAPLLAQFDAEIAELEAQGRLLRRVVWWYLLPLQSAALLLAWVLLDLVARQTGRFDAGWLLQFAGTQLAVALAVAWWNRRTVTGEIMPRLRACRSVRAEWLGQAAEPTAQD